MKKQNKTILGIFMLSLVFLSSPAFSQDEGETSNFSVGADVVTRYVWRGVNLGGNSPHVQPGIEYAFGGSGLAIGAWGSYSLGAGSGTEADLYLSYSPLDFLSFTVTDYFFPSDQGFSRNDYFNYDPDETAHTIEAMITVGGSDDIPFYATFAVNLFGADGTDENGDKYNAKYLEAGYSGSMNLFDYALFLGAALDDPNVEEGGSSWYGNEAPGIINAGFTLSKDVVIAEKAFPVNSSIIFNPEAGNFYIVFGFSL